VTLLTHRGLIRSHFNTGEIRAIPQTLNADPMHGAAITSVFFTDEWDIIFHGAGGHTSLTACANILIDHHAPASLQFLL
jgi:hypothetical protein